MKNIRVVVEYVDRKSGSSLMHWERTDIAGTSVFELLGRAFEIAQREEGSRFHDSLQAFLRGAVVQKQDVLDAMAAIP